MTDRRPAEDDPDHPTPDQQSQPAPAEEGLDLAMRMLQGTRPGPARPSGRRRPTERSDPAPATDLPPEERAAARRRGGWSGAAADGRDPHPLEETVRDVVDGQGWDLELRVHGLFARWEELVGPEVAGHSTPEAFADGRLVVRTTSTAWATQLRLLAPSLVRRLNHELGPDAVTLVEVLGPHLPTWKKGPRTVRDGRGPRDTYG